MVSYCPVLPEWLHPGFALADDEELRRLQLRWLRDELWLRRVLLCAAALGLVGLCVGAAFLPADTLRLVGGGVATLSGGGILLKRFLSVSRR
jgi:hypothetical protein